MTEQARQEYDTIRFGDPIVLLLRLLFLVASAVLIWTAAYQIPRIVFHAGPFSQEQALSIVGLGLSLTSWFLLTALTVRVTRRRRRSSGA